MALMFTLDMKVHLADFRVLVLTYLDLDTVENRFNRLLYTSRVL